MVKFWIISLLMGLLYGQSVHACDGCGGTASSSGLGILSAYAYDFAHVSWDYRPFSYTGETNHKTSDYFNSINTVGKYAFNYKWSIRFTQPWNIHIRETEDEIIHYDGLGDMELVANYLVSDNINFGDSINGMFYANVGIRIPTGKYNPNIHDENLPENFNLGKGSWGYVLQPSFVFRKNQFGWLANGSMLVYSESSSGYHFGNQYAVSTSLFKEIPCFKKHILIPNIGLNYEIIRKDRYANDNVVPDTGGNTLLCNTNLNFRWNQFLIGGSYYIILNQNSSDPTTDANNRINGQVTFIF